VFEPINIKSHSGPYEVAFAPDFLDDISPITSGLPHFIVDANIARLYSGHLASVLRLDTTILIDATEENKSIERAIPVIERLVKNRGPSRSRAHRGRRRYYSGTSPVLSQVPCCAGSNGGSYRPHCFLRPIPASVPRAQLIFGTTKKHSRHI
jgi:hypothetical protein